MIKINLSFNQIDDECFNSLGELIRDRQSLNDINLSGNKISDRGLEILLGYMIGNITFNSIDVSFNKKISDQSLPNLSEMATKSCLMKLALNDTSIPKDKQIETTNLLKVPIEDRQIPIQSPTKSAAKSGRKST